MGCDKQTRMFGTTGVYGLCEETVEDKDGEVGRGQYM